MTVQRAVERLDGIAAKKKDATSRAKAMGHKVGTWHKRRGDTYGRQDARCTKCNATVTVATTAPEPYGLPDIYGTVFETVCP